MTLFAAICCPHCGTYRLLGDVPCDCRTKLPPVIIGEGDIDDQVRAYLYFLLTFFLSFFKFFSSLRCNALYTALSVSLSNFFDFRCLNHVSRSASAITTSV